MTIFRTRGLAASFLASRAILAAERREHVRRSARSRGVGRVSRGLVLLLLLLVPLPSQANPGIVRLPFRSVNSLILVEAKVNGNAVTLVLDTGANKTIISSKAYGNVPLPVIKPINKGAGIIGNALRLRVDLELAHRFLFSQPVSVMNLDDLAQRFGVHFDGLLGQDILHEFHSVRIDYKNHVVELER